MNRNSKLRKTENEPTNGWDVLKAIVDGLFNSLGFSKAAAFTLFWFVIRDIIFVIKLPTDYNYAEHLLDAVKILSYITKNDNILIPVLFVICVVSFIFIIFLFIHNNFLRKEITRIAEARSQAMHGEHKLTMHVSSK